MINTTSNTKLRIYRGPAEVPATAQADETHTNEDTVTVSVGEALPLIADAIASERTWLTDFEHDDITISRDLYEVLSAYQYFRRPSA
ncbi:MAG: hypothetical protein GXP24_10450 [Planctomycetes bacterium]|nr:hypothetical protein [Planctomycetota bacterium]